MRILIAPDKFKGSLSAEQVCNAISKGIKSKLPRAKILTIPLADGGEGSLSILEAQFDFQKIHIEVNNPLFKPIKTFYLLDKKEAYIELAKASGLEVLNKQDRNPMLTSSFGTGEVILDAVKNGAEKINLFIGGSSTNDFGIGIAKALLFEFYNSNNKRLKPIGKNLIEISKIIPPRKNQLFELDFTVYTDVKNKLYGKNGAAFAYAEQKGASKEEVKVLDKGLQNISNLIKEIFYKNVADLKGAGAAGGIGGGMSVFFNAETKSGIDFFIDKFQVEDAIKNCDIVITGEGKLDPQTLKGKVVKGVLDICKKYKKQSVVLCGENSLTKAEEKKIGTKIISLTGNRISKQDAIENAEFLLDKIGINLFNKKGLLLNFK